MLDSQQFTAGDTGFSASLLQRSCDNQQLTLQTQLFTFRGCWIVSILTLKDVVLSAVHPQGIWEIQYLAAHTRPSEIQRGNGQHPPFYENVDHSAYECRAVSIWMLSSQHMNAEQSAYESWAVSIWMLSSQHMNAEQSAYECWAVSIWMLSSQHMNAEESAYECWAVSIWMLSSQHMNAEQSASQPAGCILAQSTYIYLLASCGWLARGYVLYCKL